MISLKELWFRIKKWDGCICPTCNKNDSLNHFVAECEDCLRKRWVEDAKKEAEQKRFDKDYEYRRAAHFMIDAMDKRGLIVTHPSHLKGGKKC